MITAQGRNDGKIKMINLMTLASTCDIENIGYNVLNLALSGF